MIKKIGFLLSGLLISFYAASAPSVEIQTSKGKIVVELNAEKAPITVQNFLTYAKEGFYNGTIFHRVIEGFMVQGGGFTPDMQQKKTGQPIENEAKNGLKNDRGAIAMARTGDPHSATAQFFINHKPNPGLDYPSRDGWGYAVFGKVTQGLDVLDRIAQVTTTNRNMHQNVPVEPVIIQTVKVLP
jgi:cyclophilin family peptidyl-prolyl cis-trans isomerase